MATISFMVRGYEPDGYPVESLALIGRSYNGPADPSGAHPEPGRPQLDGSLDQYAGRKRGQRIGRAIHRAEVSLVPGGRRTGRQVHFTTGRSGQGSRRDTHPARILGP